MPFSDICQRYVHGDGPGVAVAVLHRDADVHLTGFGLADVDHGHAMTADSVCNLASVSKQFTAFAIAALVAETGLDLDAPVSHYLGDVSPALAEVTTRHLVHHTSGLRDYFALIGLSGGRPQDLVTMSDVVGLGRRASGLNARPGTAQSYSNIGYALLTEIVAEVAGVSFVDWCSRRIFEPLGMTATRWHDTPGLVVANRAYCYASGPDGTPHHVWSHNTVIGSTGLLSSARDVARWLRHFRQPSLAPDETYRLMSSRGRLDDGTSIDYGFGLSAGTHRGHGYLTHSGAEAGWRSITVRFPDIDLAIAVLGNHVGVDAAALAMGIADEFLDTAAAPAGAPTIAAGASASAPPAEATELLATPGCYLDDRTGSTLEVSRDGDGWTLTAAAPVRLLALSGTTATVPGMPHLTLEFGPHSLTLNPGSPTSSRYVWQEPWLPDPDELAALAGTYHSDELGSALHLRLAGTKLWLAVGRRRAAPLHPTYLNAFVVTGAADPDDVMPVRLDLRLLATETDAARASVSLERITNLEFVRISRS